jgi:hypothetical protein
MVVHIFQKCRFYFENLGARRVALSKFYSEDPQFRSDLKTCYLALSLLSACELVEKMQLLCWKGQEPLSKIESPGRPGAWDLCAPRYS